MNPLLVPNDTYTLINTYNTLRTSLRGEKLGFKIIHRVLQVLSKLLIFKVYNVIHSVGLSSPTRPTSKFMFIDYWVCLNPNSWISIEWFFFYWFPYIHALRFLLFLSSMLLKSLLVATFPWMLIDLMIMLSVLYVTLS